jgi:hypothetical protein
VNVEQDDEMDKERETSNLTTEVIHRAKKLLRTKGMPSPQDRKGRADLLEPIVRQVVDELQSGISPRMVRWFAEHLALYPRIWGSMPRGPMVE